MHNNYADATAEGESHRWERGQRRLLGRAHEKCKVVVRCGDTALQSHLLGRWRQELADRKFEASLGNFVSEMK